MRMGSDFLRMQGISKSFDGAQALHEVNFSAVAGEVHAQGEGVLARLFSLAVVGDLLSVALAERAGVDPMTVDVIASLKERLAGEGL